MRILIVEDDEDMSFALTKMLKAEGYEVSAVVMAETALKMLQTEEFDLMLADLLLPGMDGAELCRRVRSNENVPSLPIILISAMPERMGFELSEKDFHWVPANRFIRKEAPLDKVLQTVRELLT